ncbi:MAG: hypothetical protein HY647_00855 [Acidobacteria bacterium]|nr:hypothetical protein [Acidobacteriota bacterium]
MKAASHLWRKISLVVMMAAISALAGSLLSTGIRDTENPLSGLRPDGQARLTSVEPLPMGDGEMCQWMPASASSTLRAALWQETAARAAESPDEAKRAEVQQRKPLRRIHDPYSAFSSVAVDPTRGEVVMTDENLFNILVYDRRANTPPTATMTEPKRMIGGESTKIEFQCGLYIDPASGDIYAVNNDTKDTLVIFGREQRGDVPPKRELYTPHGTFGIAIDEAAEEMYLTVQHDNGVVVFHKYAEKDDAPVRLVQGNRTMLADPHGIAIDTKNNVMFVSNHGNYHEKQTGGEVSSLGRGKGKANWPVGDHLPGSGKYLPPSITVYPLKASGNVAPLRVIQGPKTQMNWPSHLAMDVERQELYVANDMGDSILVFSASASGDAAPIRVLKGGKTLIKNPTGIFLDLENDELWVANFGNHTATVYRRGASGDTPPLRMIRSAPLDEPTLSIGNPHPVGYDSKREEILVPN